MQATYLPTKVRYLVSAAAFTLLLNTGMAQTPAPAAETTTTTTTTTTSDVPIVTTSGTESPTVMTPFEVDSSQDTGYRARSSLAGSRVNTDLKDIANPITVVTKDFLTDIGAADVNDILTYEVGTEGTKDFSSNTPQLGRTSDNATQDPAGATRGRGLAAFDFTRDYFYSLSDVTTGYSAQSVGFDTYNLSDITISRGADSILAGLGSPAGIINLAPYMAGLERSYTDVSYRFGSYSDERAVLNANIVAIPDVLGFFVAGLYKNQGFEQQPAYNLDRRYYLASTYKPFKKTTIHASYELANIHEHLPNTFTPEDDITQWIQLGKPAAPLPGAVSGNAPIANSNAVFYQGLNTGPNVYYTPNGTIFGAYNDSTTYYYQQQNLSNVALWAPLRMSNDEYGNWHDLNTNGTEQRNSLSTINVSLDQEIFHGLNLNIAVVHEIADYTELNLGRPDYVADMVDVNQELPDGATNPFYGNTMMYFAGLDNQNATYSRNTVARATLTYDLDLTKYNKWFGRYVATGFAEDRRTTHDFIDYNAQQAAAGTTVGGGPGVVTYTGGNSANSYFTTQTAQLPTLFTDVPFINNNGTTTNNFTTVYALKEEEKDITKLTTSAVVLQAYLLDNLAVGTFGLRRDVDQAGFASSSNDPASGLVLPLASSNFDGGQPLTQVQAQTKTYGVVLHGPKIGEFDLHWLSVAYDQSQNFIPNAGSIDLLGNPTPDPTGTTKDYSVIVDLFGGRLNAKIDWYTTVAANAADATVNFPLVQWTIPFEVLENNGGGNGNGIGAYADLARQIGFTGYSSGLAPGITTGDPQLANAYTSSQQSKGVEFELTYNVTKNWRVFGTVTRQQAEESNIAPALTSFINGRIAYWQANGLWNGPTTTKQDWCGCPETGQQVFNDQVIGPFVAYQAASGQPSQQLHKWKATLVTNYTFDQGIAKGFGIGTGIRYFDKTVLGNPAILTNGAVTGLNLANPYTVPGETSVEAWLTYQRRLFANKYLLTFRLEVDNLQTSGGYLPVSANSDGTHQLFTIAPPRTYYFTTELKF
jgi:outer membrane receptor protein involved in Fe transport